MGRASSPITTVVLVHGAWADASSWRRVIALLQEQDTPVIAVQNPTTSLADDVAATRLALDAVYSPVVLVGHSWGGSVITQAGVDPKVKALVYVAAFAPDVGESTGDLVGSYPVPPALRGLIDDGAGHLKVSVESWISDIAQDLPEAEARVLAATQPPLGQATLTDKITQAAWADRPSWYVVSSEDRAMSVELQRALAARLKARKTEVKAGHLSLLSAPEAVAAVICDAVLEVAAGPANRP